MTSSHDFTDGRDVFDFADAVNAGTTPTPQTDLEFTYLRVQQAMQMQASALPADTKQATWENVMTTLALAPDRPVSNRTRKSALRAARSRQPWARVQWTPLASVAAVALMLLASVGAWRAATYDSSPPPESRQVAGIVPTTGDLLQVATPQEVAESADPTYVSVPIVSGVDQQPFDGPVVWLTTTGEVYYDDGVSEVQTLATGATRVSSQNANVVQIFTDTPDTQTNKEGEDVGSYVMTYHNLANGKSLVDDGSFSSYLGGPNSFGPLTVLTIADAPREWSVVNFTTMESTSISELTGGNFRSSESISVQVSDDHSVIAVGSSQYESEASSVLVKQSGLPGEVAVIPADLSGVTWVSIPEGMPKVGNMSVSSDGSSIAFISIPWGDEDASTTISVVDVATNEELVRVENIEREHGASFEWVNGGDAFVILNGNVLERYTLDGSEPTVLLESAGEITLLPRINVQNILHVWVTSEMVTEGTPTPASSQFVIVDTATGHTITVDGKPRFTGNSSPESLRTRLAPIPVTTDDQGATLYHPVTGEALSDLVVNVDNESLRQDVEIENSVAFYELQTVTTAYLTDVSVGRLADGNLAVITTTVDSFEANVIELPDELRNTQVSLSADGRYLIAGNSWSLAADETVSILDLWDDDAEWLTLPAGTPVFFADVLTEG